MKSEAEVQNEIILWCSKHSHMRIFRQNTGVAEMANGRRVRFGVPGQADLRCVVGPKGRLVEIEVKRPGGKQSDAQVKYQKMIENLGGVYILAFSVVDVRNRMVKEFSRWKWNPA